MIRTTRTLGVEHSSMSLQAWLVLGITAAALILLAVLLARGHTTGGELEGVVAAVLAVLAGILTYRSQQGHRGRIGLALAGLLWAAVIVLGVTGTLDHAHAVRPSSADQRPRPALVPLVFSALGLGGLAVGMASRRRGTTCHAQGR